MKREGRQHGMVRTYELISMLHQRPESRVTNKLMIEKPLTAGFFYRVSAKPTNHSKFTGKCGKPRCNSCHFSPACKAKNKTKGKHKSDMIKSSNDTVSYKDLDRLAYCYDHLDYE